MAVIQVEPTSGVLEGGTLATITGTNLGYKFPQILNATTLAGILCPAMVDRYVVSRRYFDRIVLLERN